MFPMFAGAPVVDANVTLCATFPPPFVQVTVPPLASDSANWRTRDECGIDARLAIGLRRGANRARRTTVWAR
jgi:hypothetical protein